MAQRLRVFRVNLARRIWLWLMTGSMERYQVYLPPYPMMLEQNQLESCRVVCHRKELLAQLSLRANPNVAEIGVLRGDFSQVLMEQLRPANLHLFDLDFKGHRIAERFASEIAAGRVHLHEGDSSSNVSTFPLEYFDVVYIDGDHSYLGVKKDIEASVPRLSAQGYLTPR
jgi:predicted O-methyltransferase YrrM